MQKVSRVGIPSLGFVIWSKSVKAAGVMQYVALPELFPQPPPSLNGITDLQDSNLIK